MTPILPAGGFDIKMEHMMGMMSDGDISMPLEEREHSFDSDIIFPKQSCLLPMRTPDTYTISTDSSVVRSTSTEVLFYIHENTFYLNENYNINL